MFRHTTLFTLFLLSTIALISFTNHQGKAAPLSPSTTTTLSSDTESLEARRPPTKTLKNKLVFWTDFSTGVTACGLKGSKKINRGFFLGVDTRYGMSACGKQAIITGPNGKTVIGTVIDLGGSKGSINVSPALFLEFATLDQGVTQATYTFL